DLQSTDGATMTSDEPTITGPSYDYDTLCMILCEAQNFELALKLGLSETQWISAKSTINAKTLDWLKKLYCVPSDVSASFFDNIDSTRLKIMRHVLGL